MKRFNVRIRITENDPTTNAEVVISDCYMNEQTVGGIDRMTQIFIENLREEHLKSKEAHAPTKKTN